MDPVPAMARQSFDRLFAVNLAGTLFNMQAAARPMIARGRGGKVIDLPSQAGRRGEGLFPSRPSTWTAATG